MNDRAAPSLALSKSQSLPARILNKQNKPSMAMSDDIDTVLYSLWLAHACCKYIQMMAPQTKDIKVPRFSGMAALTFHRIPLLKKWVLWAKLISSPKIAPPVLRSDSVNDWILPYS